MAVGQASDLMKKLTKTFIEGLVPECLSLAGPTVAQLEGFASSDYLWVISLFIFISL